LAVAVHDPTSVLPIRIERSGVAFKPCQDQLRQRRNRLLPSLKGHRLRDGTTHAEPRPARPCRPSWSAGGCLLSRGIGGRNAPWGRWPWRPVSHGRPDRCGAVPWSLMNQTLGQTCSASIAAAASPAPAPSRERRQAVAAGPLGLRSGLRAGPDRQGQLAGRVSSVGGVGGRPGCPWVAVPLVAPEEWGIYSRNPDRGGFRADSRETVKQLEGSSRSSGGLHWPAWREPPAATPEHAGSPDCVGGSGLRSPRTMGRCASRGGPLLNPDA
jgi:hypothetical protein